MPIAKVTAKGQITVPKPVRDRLGLAPGDELEFTEVDGEYRVRRRVRESAFAPYLGYLAELEGCDPDELVRDLRGHE